VITVVQRVLSASVTVEGTKIASIDKGLVLLVGVERGDTEADADITARKISALRIFEGRTPMDVSLSESGASVLVVSQFTLAARLHKGNRPSFEGAENPDKAEPLYLRVARKLSETGVPVQTGRFRSDMKVSLVNDGPVTFVVEVRDGTIVKRKD